MRSRGFGSIASPQFLQRGRAETLDGKTVIIDQMAEVVWAITSANHASTMRNPVAGTRRLGMIEAIAAAEPLRAQCYLITNMAPKSDFAHYVVEEIATASRGQLCLTPENCLVACSTPAVISQYQKLGFAILPVELQIGHNQGRTAPLRPWEVIERLIATGSQWRADPEVCGQLHQLCLEHYERYGLGDLIVETYQDPLTNSTPDGDLTTTRDYETYRAAFEDNAFRKVQEFAHEVVPGRILDIGCATGQTIKLLSQQPILFESDFYGVEAARPLFDICQQRKSNGEFGSANVFFHQRNILRGQLFPLASLSSIISMALTHEIESYLGHDALLDFIQRMYDMLAPGGIYINYDVVGPGDKDAVVYARFTDTDGDNPTDLYPAPTELGSAAFLGTLSSQARFKRFTQDFRAAEAERIDVRYETIDSIDYAVLRWGDLADFLAKKDYLQSWFSEMHERFCFWDYSDWIRALRQVGFEIKPTSRPMTNQWLIEQRFQPAAAVWTKNQAGTLQPADVPATNMLIFAVKPR